MMAECAGQDGDGAAVPPPNVECAQEKGEAEARLEAAESEQEDEEDVFEVESILDSKLEGDKVLYRVRWKGYDSSGDTWEPEEHLEDCKEVLLEFRRKHAESKPKPPESKPKPAESKPKPAKKEASPKLPLEDLFEAESDTESKEETPQKKKKKSKGEEDEDDEDERLQEELKKKKSKSGKCKEKSKPEVEPDSQPTESKPKKRLSESREDLSSKKPKKDDTRDSKKAKKEEAKNTKVKEDQKEKKPRKSSGSDLPKEETLSVAPETETVSVNSDVLSEDRDKVGQEEEPRNPEATPPYQAEELSFGGPIEEEMEEVKLKKKKKKHKKKNEDSKAMLVDLNLPDKKNLVKKQKSLEKFKEAPAAEKLQSPVPKRPSTDDRARKSMDSLTENEIKKAELPKEKPKKKHENEKEAKKELKVVKPPKEHKQIYDAFTISPEDREEHLETTRKEQEFFDFRPLEDCKPREVKHAFKERRPTQEDTDLWNVGAPEGDQEVMDTVHHLQENSVDGKAQGGGMAVDLQLEWMTLEDFQRHLDGSDEIIPKDPISNNALKEAVKNGDYLTVKYAFNSKEEYNLDQEDSSGMTLVMMAAAAGQDDILRLLIRKGAKINARQKNGMTALIHAAEKNYLTTVSILLEAGAFVNIQQASGETALMKACKRGNYDIVRILIEQGADCNVLSKHQGNALQFAKQSNNVLVFELINSHLEKLSRVVEDAIKDYFETRLAVLEPIFPIVCHRLCEGPDFSLDFNYKHPYNIPEESGILLFVFHANFFGKEVVVRLSGPCSVQAVVLNDKFQLPVFLDAHFIYSFSPITGPNKLFIRLSEVPSAKVKLLISAYRVQLH